jgi:hypothetical protein
VPASAWSLDARLDPRSPTCVEAWCHVHTLLVRDRHRFVAGVSSGQPVESWKAHDEDRSGVGVDECEVGPDDRDAGEF